MSVRTYLRQPKFQILTMLFNVGAISSVDIQTFVIWMMGLEKKKKKKKGGNRFPLKAFSTDVECEPNRNPAHRLSAVKHMFPRSYLWWEIKILTCNMC